MISMSNYIFCARKRLISGVVAAFFLFAIFATCDARAVSSAAYNLFIEDKQSKGVLQEDVFCEKLENKERQCSRLNELHLPVYFSLFAAIAWGAAVRTVIKTFDLSIPYTVVLTITGLIVGLGSRIDVGFCEKWSPFTRFARTPPELILYVFLPVLLFESAYSMNPHVFFRSCTQILTVAIPGMLISTFLTAFACYMAMTEYQWTFSQAALFGAIVSATDPVAVVAILRESGTSETLSVMIEGESLLNDGVAILLYDIFKEIVENPDTVEDPIEKIAQTFLMVTIGGPLLGVCMGKLTVLCLSLVFNDAATEITITLVSAYLTYFIAEFFLHFSGVMALVALGVTISNANTAVSPDVVHVMKQFWEMMSFLSNTVLFVLLGIVVTETAINSITPTIDIIYLVWLYFTVHIIRFVMLLILSPFLSRAGYGIHWRNIIVMTWGGLRGAIGICLALEIFRSAKLCNLKNVGPKFLLQIAGIVISTLLINGTTTKMVLDALGITTLSIGKLQDMATAIKCITTSRLHAIATYRHSRFLEQSHWEHVHRYTHLKDPYGKKHKEHERKAIRQLEARKKAQHDKSLLEKKDPRPPVPSIVSSDSIRSDDNTNSTEVVYQEAEEGSEEFKANMEETRLRVLKAYKISMWRQYEQGTLGDQAVKILVSAVEEQEDQFLTMLHGSDISLRWGMPAFFVDVKKQIYSFIFDETIPAKPKWKWRRPFYWISTQAWLDILIYVVILLNLVTIIMALSIEQKENRTKTDEDILIIVDRVEVGFLCIYAAEFAIKIIGRGPKNYFSSGWNWLDFIVLIISTADTILTFVRPPKDSATQVAAFSATVKAVRLIRFFRLIRWLKPLLPLINRYLETRINSQLFLDYDVGRGYVQAIEDTVNFVDQMTLNERVERKFKQVLNAERLKTLTKLAKLEESHPGVVAAVKTLHTSRAICNHMKEELKSIKEDGLLNEKEFEALSGSIEENMKRLWSLPSSFKETPSLINHLPWLMGSEVVRDFFTDKACVQTLSAGDMIYYVGDEPNGLHLITSGLIHIHYKPDEDNGRDEIEKGVVPNTEMFSDTMFATELDEYFGRGFLLGEMGVLVGNPRASAVQCETDVTLYHWPRLTVRDGIGNFGGEFDSLESRLWRSYGIKYAAEFLRNQSKYASWSLEKIRSHLEQGIVPIGHAARVIDVPEEVTECILIYGQCQSYQSREVYSAPRCLPTSTKDAYVKIDNDTEVFRVLIVADYEALQSIRGSSNLSPIRKCFIYGPVMKDLGDALNDETDMLRETPTEDSVRIQPMNGSPSSGSTQSNISRA